jgi:predicted phosphodiesterase
VLCKEEFGLSNKLQKRLDLVESLKALQDVADAQVDALEKLYGENLESVKKEKWKRKLKEKLIGVDGNADGLACAKMDILKELENVFGGCKEGFGDGKCREEEEQQNKYFL